MLEWKMMENNEEPAFDHENVASMEIPKKSGVGARAVIAKRGHSGRVAFSWPHTQSQQRLLATERRWHEIVWNH